MDDLKKAWDELNAKITTCDSAGVNGTRVADLKELAKKVDEEIKKLND